MDSLPASEWKKYKEPVCRYNCGQSYQLVMDYVKGVLNFQNSDTFVAS